MKKIRLLAGQGNNAPSIQRGIYTGGIFRFLLGLFFSCYGNAILMADDVLIIDDRRTGERESVLGSPWRMVTDGVMGGVSSGELTLDTIDNKACLRLRGDVRLENNGGFIQAALDVEGTAAADASGYDGLLLGVYGNDHEYNLHLRTGDVWLPWQSYRVSFRAPASWQTLRLPFSEFSGYRIGKKLNLKRLERIGIVAIGRAFSADLCIGDLAFYRDMD
jgi:hypothetical protein